MKQNKNCLKINRLPKEDAGIDLAALRSEKMIEKLKITQKSGILFCIREI